MITATVVAATPLIYAALSEAIVEKADVLNVGIEGMMLIGAFPALPRRCHRHGTIGFTAAAAAGVALSLASAFSRSTCQPTIATGLALSLFGLVYRPSSTRSRSNFRCLAAVDHDSGATNITVIGEIFFH